MLTQVAQKVCLGAPPSCLEDRQSGQTRRQLLGVLKSHLDDPRRESICPLKPLGGSEAHPLSLPHPPVCTHCLLVSLLASSQTGGARVRMTGSMD